LRKLQSGTETDGHCSGSIAAAVHARQNPHSTGISSGTTPLTVGDLAGTPETCDVTDADARLVALAADQHQVFSRAQARAAGLSASTTSRRIAAGKLVVCGTSALHLPGVTLTYRGRLMAGLLDLGPEALVSGRAAAHLHGLDCFPEGPLEFLVPRRLRNRRTPGNLTSTRFITALDRMTIDGLRCTSATRTVVELLATASRNEAGNALDSATRRRLTAPAVVERRLLQLGQHGRAGLVAFRELASVGAVESWLERLVLRVVSDAGLPALLLQQRYELPGVGVARVDFEFATFPIVVEVGGQHGYLSREERQRQERRRNELQLRGKIVYFFTRDDVVNRPNEVVVTLFAAIKRHLGTSDGA
jgi:hypothetical protein